MKNIFAFILKFCRKLEKEKTIFFVKTLKSSFCFLINEKNKKLKILKRKKGKFKQSILRNTFFSIFVIIFKAIFDYFS